MKSIFLVLLMFCSIAALAQNEKKMKNNFRIKLNPNFDSTLPISFDHSVQGKHGFEKVTEFFNSGFEKEGFTVTNANPRYVIMMDYKYGYAIAYYKMQYSDLVAEIIDIENDSAVVGTFSYTGRYDNDYLGPAVAKEVRELVDKMRK